MTALMHNVARQDTYKHTWSQH